MSIAETRKAAKRLEVAMVASSVGVGSGSVWTWPEWRIGVVLNAWGDTHARDETGAHINLNVSGGPDHGIKLRMNHDGGTGNNGWTLSVAD